MGTNRRSTLVDRGVGPAPSPEEEAAPAGIADGVAAGATSCAASSQDRERALELRSRPCQGPRSDSTAAVGPRGAAARAGAGTLAGLSR